MNFLAEHADWFEGEPEAAVDVVADTLEPVTEVMNLLVRRNLPFQAVSQSGLARTRSGGVGSGRTKASCRKQP